MPFDNQGNWYEDKGSGPVDIEIQVEPRQVLIGFWGIIGAALLIWGGMTCFFTVEAYEEAVILRLGKVHTIAGPGFHGKIPFGVDKVFKEAVKTVHQAEFGYRTIKAGVKSSFDRSSAQVVAEATMLTGDQNLVLVNWEVRYKIKDLQSYLFKVRKPVETLRAVSEAVMRIELGDRSVDEALTLQRPQIESAVKAKMQASLDAFECGIHIVKVNLKNVDPPDAVKDAFNAVNRAIQVRNRIVNEAEGERNKKIPAARGQKDRMMREAEGYAIGRLNRAKGETEAFLSVLEEYRKAEDITRRRLYLDSMETALPKAGDVTLLDSTQSGVLKMLDLSQPQGATPTTTRRRRAAASVQTKATGGGQ
ncbi:MAG: FtsH protease activity modulator HflK [Myxococcota bacterium]|nr:FtsH protease activity modulator HflK [Myxococcota bacterium]